MCKDGDVFLRYANAERELCEMAGAVLTSIINEIESRHGIRIAELRVTMDRASWPERLARCELRHGARGRGRG